MNETQHELPTGTADRPQEYRAEVSFDDLGLSPELRRAIGERGYTHPTPVQARAYPAARAGKDLIVRSKTGTGKTAAFGMPIIDQIPVGARGVRALIMCPTRELAIQVAQELEILSQYRDIALVCIYGGASMSQQEDALRKGAAIVVGTPGRIHDHIRRGNMKLEQCVHAVLDEADEMLNQGFYEEVTRILDFLPKQKQVLLFSATVPDDIQRLISRYTTNAETLLLSGDVYTVEHIRHVRYELSDAYPKPRNLLYVLEMENPENAIVFCNTRDDTELVTAVLNRNGFDAELLNGDLAQKERERVMARVKKGELAFMVATDIAARGIDISDLGHVINYSLPEDPAVYLHRVGRTGRIGKKGTALNLTSGRELATLTALEKKYNVKFERKPMPTAEEAATMWTERHVRDLKEAAAGSIYEGFLGLAGDLKKRGDADELIAFMLRYFFTHRRMDKAQAEPSTEPQDAQPARESKPKADRGGRREREGGGRREKSPREERPRRERSHEEKPVDRSEAVTDPNKTPVGGVQAVAPAAAKPASAPRKKLSDRELFELMQAGKPLPPIDDPTDSSGGDEPYEERRPRRDRGERSERRPRRESVPVEAGHVRVWTNLSRSEAADEAALKAAVAALGLPADKVAKVDVRDTYSYLHVAEADVGEFDGKTGKHGEKDVKLEKERDRNAAPERRERPPRREAVATDAGHVRVWTNLSKSDAADEAAAKAALASLGLPADKIAKVDVRDTYSYLHVAEADVGAFDGKEGKHGDKSVRFEKERPRDGAAPARRTSKVAAPGNARLWINVSKDEAATEEALKALVGAAGAPVEKIATVDLRGTYSYLHVAEGDIAEFEAALQGKPHGDKTFKVERSRR
ncbi:MAG: DEAD/DEAH box helicase [Archangium gephyra]|uniref:DEAD/DEAH box helicase n=1 Tax=Archangium gephyra TaxID=48 RepID=A0A2W5T805_9BACT|nr:MAG: DEAD/DEAH box helicase [Archangium gephyra]